MIKKTFKYAIAVSVAFLAGCAGTDSGTDADITSGTALESAIKNDSTNPQAPMDPDTDMSEENPKKAETVSANNEIGREMNIVALVQRNPNLSTLMELIMAAGLLETLESPAPYTVFAPTNAAFDALPAGTIEALKQPSNQLELTRILQSHILPNRITTPEMEDNMPMKTAQGQPVIVKRKGNTILVGDAKVLASDIEASNGIIHIVDRVLLPPK